MEENLSAADVKDPAQPVPEEKGDPEHISRHERKLLEKQEKEKQREGEAKKMAFQRAKRKAVKYGILLLVVVGVAFLVYKGVTAPPSYTNVPVHWHAKIHVELCGEDQGNLVGGQTGRHGGGGMWGPMLRHTHGDNLIHIEGQVRRAEDIALGKFFEGIGITFTSTTIEGRNIDGKKNGDLCGDKPGAVQLLVDGQQNTQFENYIPKDGDDIKVVFA